MTVLHVFKTKMKGQNVNRIDKFIHKRKREKCNVLPQAGSTNFMISYDNKVTEGIYYGYFPKQKELYKINNFVPKNYPDDSDKCNYEKILIKRKDNRLLKKTLWLHI